VRVVATLPKRRHLLTSDAATHPRRPAAVPASKLANLTNFEVEFREGHSRDFVIKCFAGQETSDMNNCVYVNRQCHLVSPHSAGQDDSL